MNERQTDYDFQQGFRTEFEKWKNQYEKETNKKLNLDVAYDAFGSMIKNPSGGTYGKATVKTWWDGKTPRVSVLKQMCVIFDCDMNRLFGAEYITDKEKAACEYTGLSMNAIRALHKNEHDKRVVIDGQVGLVNIETYNKELLSYLLESKNFQKLTDDIEYWIYDRNKELAAFTKFIGRDITVPNKYADMLSEKDKQVRKHIRARRRRYDISESLIQLMDAIEKDYDL